LFGGGGFTLVVPSSAASGLGLVLLICLGRLFYGGFGTREKLIGFPVTRIFNGTANDLWLRGGEARVEGERGEYS